MYRSVELVRTRGRVERVADRDLVADDEHALVRGGEQAAEAVRVAMSSLVKALAAGKAVGTDVLALPGAVVLDRQALQLPDPHVVEELLLRDRYVAALHRDPRRLDRPPEARVQTDVERQRPDLETQQRRLLAAALRQRGRPAWVAVDTVFVVQDRLGVSAEHEQAHARDPTALTAP